MTISTCIIAKNEEETIERILKCAAKFSDEIIFVDTGSSDNTVAIASKYTDKIYNFKWQNDFALARNFAFSKAKCEYLAWFDADDFITDENLSKILKLKSAKTRYDTYMFKYSCGFDEKGEPLLTFYRERLMLNCALAKFVGVVHETVSPFGKVAYTQVEVEHRKIKPSAPKRNLNIYRKIAKNANLSPRDLYYFGKEYYYNGYFKSAIKTFKKLLKNKGVYEPDLKDAYITLYDCALKTGENKPIKYLLNCLEKCFLDGEVFCKLGDEFSRLGNLQKSLDFYKCALTFEPSKFGFVRQEYYHIYPLLQLVKICYDLGRVDESLFYHKKCVDKYPNDERVVFNARFFEKSGLV